jgi:Xaa-Pro aminopeptidase
LPADSASFAARLDAARSVMAERGLDVLLVGEPANRRYLSGFAGHDDSAQASSGWVVLTPTHGYFLTTFNYFAGVEQTVRHLEPVQAKPRMLDALVELLRQTPGATIGFEGGWVSFDLYDRLRKDLPAARRLESVGELVEELRAVKDEAEIAALRRAIAATDRAYVDVIAGLRPGQTEREVAWAIEKRLRELGAEGMAFGPSVAAGPHAAVPHHEPTDDAIKAGEPVWIDLGALLDGYCGDLTRSFCLESAPPDYLATYELVQRAQEAALRGLRAGLTGQEADALARDVIATAGRGDEFGHGLGHGIGLAIHERPRVGREVEERLRPGTIVTVEPGVYRPGWGGVRIEDVVLVGETGVEVLSKAPKTPVISSG